MEENEHHSEETPIYDSGPIRHAKLPDPLVDRIRRVKSIVSEVEPGTLEEWLDSFKRDVHPEDEVRIWESIASAYAKFTQQRDLSLDAKREALDVLLQCSITSELSALASRRDHLSRADVQMLRDLYIIYRSRIKVMLE